MSISCEAVKERRLLLSAKESAATAGVGLRTWHRMWRSGLAPEPVRIGLGVRPMTRWARAELESWIDAGCPPAVGKGGAA